MRYILEYTTALMWFVSTVLALIDHGNRISMLMSGVDVPTNWTLIVFFAITLILTFFAVMNARD